MNLLFVQTGDFRDAYKRLEAGQSETYRDQRLSVDYVAGFAPSHRVTTLSLGSEDFSEQLGDNLWAMGMDRSDQSRARIRSLFDRVEPTHVILRSPFPGFLRETRKRGLYLLPCFADLFQKGGPRTTLRHVRLRRDLLRSRAPCYSNHSLNASRSFVSGLGLPAEKIVPWDWSKVPMAGPPKPGIADPHHPRAFFAGALSVPKGVLDCLQAIALMKERGQHLSMTFAGNGDLAEWRGRAADLGIDDRVTFPGMVSNGEVRAGMTAADIVVVPSRPSYPEGLPNTIYEALASRSALVLSDHPAFAGRLTPEEEAIVFEAGNPGSLADAVLRLVRDPALYARLSENSERAHDRLYVGMSWTDLVDAFLADPENRSGWVERNALPHATPAGGAVEI